MIDTYLQCADEELLRSFCSFFTNVIGPVKGRDAIACYEGEAGLVPAEPAVGDPFLFYACIRGPILIPAPIQGQIYSCDEDTGAAVCGVWS